MLSPSERAANGAAVLDLKAAGWEWKVDLDTLDIGDDCKCALGQNFGSFMLGLDAIDIHLWDRGTQVALGFIWDGKAPILCWQTEIDALTAAWRRLILARRAEHPRIEMKPAVHAGAPVRV